MQLDALNLPPPCSIMAMLIDLLGDMPVGQDRQQTEFVGERLDRLEFEARWHGVPEATLAAIEGARVLLLLGKIPPLPRRGVRHECDSRKTMQVTASARRLLGDETEITPSGGPFNRT
jgi:hypothetical protein